MVLGKAHLVVVTVDRIPRPSLGRIFGSVGAIPGSDTPRYDYRKSHGTSRGTAGHSKWPLAHPNLLCLAQTLDCWARLLQGGSLVVYLGCFSVLVVVHPLAAAVEVHRRRSV